MKFHIYIPQEIEDIEFDIEIDLSDSEKKEIMELVDPVADLDFGLIPLLEDKGICMSEKGEDYPLYDKFCEAIIHKVFVESLIEKINNGDIKKAEEDNYDDLRQVDPDILFDIYAPYFSMCTSDYVCEIPKELIPKVYLTKEATNEDIHRYIHREQQNLIWSLYHHYNSDSLFESEDFDYSLMEWIEERLSKIVSERIKEASPDNLLRDDYNPLSDVNEDNLSKLYPDPIPISEIEMRMPDCPAPLTDNRLEDAFKSSEYDEFGYSDSIPAISGYYISIDRPDGIETISAKSAVIESRLYTTYLDEKALIWDYARGKLLLYIPDEKKPRTAFKGGTWWYAKKLKQEFEDKYTLEEIYQEYLKQKNNK